MTAVREIVDSSSLADIFDLPPVLMHRKIEVIMFPVEEKSETIPKVTMAQIDEWTQTPELQALAGLLKGADLPPDISMKDIVTRNKSDFSSVALPVVSPDELLALLIQPE